MSRNQNWTGGNKYSKFWICIKVQYSFGEMPRMPDPEMMPNDHLTLNVWDSFKSIHIINDSIL